LKKMIGRFVVRFLAIAALLLAAQAASAQPGPTANEVLSQPQFVNGGQDLASAIQSLMGDKSEATLAAIINFAKTANEDQRKAIGQGLAAVAKAAAAAGDPQFVDTVQHAVVISGLPELQKAYADAGGDTGTASAGGGGGGGGGGPTTVGPPTGGPNTGSTPGGNTFPANLGTSLTITGTGGGGFTQPSSRSVTSGSPG
jgi:hypothetical protein